VWYDAFVRTLVKDGQRTIALGRVAKDARGRFHVFDEHRALSGLAA
jgi:hypothetical protein